MNTRERLLEAAERLFGERGYREVSVREITRVAGCNVAAVNYHFGCKRDLYLEVFRSRWLPRTQKVREHFRALVGDSPASAAEVIRALTVSIIDGPLDEEERLRHRRLMFRELTQPTEALSIIIDQGLRPFFSEVVSLLRPFLPPSHPQDRLFLSVLSIMAQIIHFNVARPKVSALLKQPYDDALKARIIEHIVTFSLRGLGLEAEEI
ncbi:helix-turn-helix transcriptional regulator [Thermosulfuriphilus ammonigenes]|uniref:Helix-turn-helix transcriptional regulator n=1 Tax=Thermosulfuriphilus ammonigenes TaxID=1936021 RepID=A0A6G7PTX0_9BACT|nr:CerR family C-terminal domain-containing protein [Thermosulfuriphilus ammonigenes]MBA2848738.1 AcrR family transcriptional regulator [Thermosulfuriphilus ammonigenes]QIJ71129.1 helix-turn-helix transcriptional regulator [Thermosulfuriphilus ammonigenes]